MKRLSVLMAGFALLAAASAEESLPVVDFGRTAGHVRRLNGVNGTARISNICNPKAEPAKPVRQEINGN